MVDYRDEFYVVLLSNASMNVYEDNHPANFTVKLPENIVLPGTWEVAATEFQFTNEFNVFHGKEHHSSDSESEDHKRVQAIFAYSDIVDHQFVGDVKAQLLGIIPVIIPIGQREHWTFSPAYYSRVQPNSFDTIKVWLADQCGDELVFWKKKDFVMIRLHFRRCRV